MDYNKRPILHLVTKGTFEIPNFQRLYSWKADNCIKLVEKVLDSVQNRVRGFAGNIFLENIDNGTKLRIYDGQQRTISVFLFYLALLSVGRLKNISSLMKKFKKLDIEEDIQNKFLINNNDKERFEEFVQGFIKYNEEHDTASPALVFNSQTDNNFIKNYLVFFKQINAALQNATTNNFLDEMYQALDCLDVVVVSREESEQNNGLVASKIFDCLNATGMPLSLVDIISSQISLLGDENLVNSIKSFAELYIGENQETPDQYIHQEYLKVLGYNSANIAKNFKNELKYRTTICNGEIEAYSSIFKDLNLVYNFLKISKLKYSEISEIKKCFYPEDQYKLSESLIQWIKMYLDGIRLFNSERVEIALYIHYLEKKITFVEFLDCLHCYWVAVMRSILIKSYRKVQVNSFKKTATLLLNLRNNESKSTFVDEFKDLCSTYIKPKGGVDYENSKALAASLVHELERNPTSISTTKGNKFHEYDTPLAYFLHLLLFVGPEKKFNSRYKLYTLYNQDMVSSSFQLKKSDLGNLVLVESRESREELEFVTDEQRISYCCFNGVKHQKLLQNNEVNVNALIQRSQNILEDLFDVLKSTNNSHLPKY